MNHPRTVMWTPNENDTSLLTEYIGFLGAHHDLSFKNYAELHQWSVEYAEKQVYLVLFTKERSDF